MIDRQKFIDMMLPAAQKYGQQIGVDPRIIVVQAAHETGWAASAPGHNYFGIKSHGESGGQNLTTHEFLNGQNVKTNDSFRTYNSPEDSVAGYASFLSGNPRYQPMLKAQGLDAQIDALGKSGYATDPNYAQAIGSIAHSIPVSSMVAAQPASPPQAPGTPAPAMGQPVNIGTPPEQPAPQVAQGQQQQPQQTPSMMTAFQDFKNGDMQGGLKNVFGSLSGMGNAMGGGQQSAPMQPAPTPGPSQQQMQALSQVLAGLGRRRSNQA